MASLVNLRSRSSLGACGSRCRLAATSSRTDWRHSSRPTSGIARQLSGASRSPLSRSNRLVACNGLFGLGLPEIAVIAGIAALVFGPSKLPELGKGLGKTLKSFQTAAGEFEKELKAASAPEDDAAKKAEEEKSNKA